MRWGAGRSGAAAAAAIASALLLAAAPAAATQRPAALVNPFQGTEAGAEDFGTGGGAGNTYPGATAPFGMLNWSPDTDPSLINFAGGYTYSDPRIKGFSLTHLSGAGCSGYQDFPFIPTTERIDEAPATVGTSDLDPDLLAGFSHRQESASPGRYSVELDPSEPKRRIGVDLAADTRAGVGRFSYPEGRPSNLLINAAGNGMANPMTSVKIDPAHNEISGVSETGAFCWARGYFKIYMVARFDKRFADYGTWTNDELAPRSKAARDTAVNALNLKPLEGLPNPGTSSTTAQAGAYVGFGAGKRVTARVGISFTSTADARKALRAEVGDDTVASQARQAEARWNDALGRVDVSGGSQRNLRTFYSTLYHALLEPRTFSDRDGSYPLMGRNGGVGRTQGTEYADFSGWDTYRTQIPLLGILFPKRAADFADSLLDFTDGGGCLPKWSFGSTHSMIMTGDPADQALSALDALGVDIDRDRALDAMLRGAEGDCTVADPPYFERPGGQEYIDQGYVGYEREAEYGRDNSRFGNPQGLWGPAATTLEYASADFAIARMAARNCEGDVYTRMMRRSGSWQNLFNPATKRIEPRLRSGAWHSVAADSRDGFVEGSSAQYTWMVPHDPAGLAAALGGRDAALARLDDFFAELNTGQDSEHAFLGNEPNLNAPWLYDWLGRPSSAQRIVREAQLSLYGPGPGGYPGNDDLGTMSSWWVLASLGLYPAIPGEDVLAIGSPLFESATLRLGGGRELRIRAPKAAPARPYVAGLELGGSTHKSPWLRFRKLRGGGTLDFALAAEPTRWGSAPKLAPPSFGPRRPAGGSCG
jgi:predicted alpha-1,2-mannosidase